MTGIYISENKNTIETFPLLIIVALKRNQWKIITLDCNYLLLMVVPLTRINKLNKGND